MYEIVNVCIDAKENNGIFLNKREAIVGLY